MVFQESLQSHLFTIENGAVDLEPRLLILLFVCSPILFNKFVKWMIFIHIQMRRKCSLLTCSIWLIVLGWMKRGKIYHRWLIVCPCLTICDHLWRIWVCLEEEKYWFCFTLWFFFWFPTTLYKSYELFIVGNRTWFLNIVEHWAPTLNPRTRLD